MHESSDAVFSPVAESSGLEFTDRRLNDPPFTEAFVFERRWLPDLDGGLDCAVVYTNVPHLCVEHSPMGFEIGYGGSGPADTALNMIEAVLRTTGYRGRRAAKHRGACFALASALHQRLKSTLVAQLDRDSAVVPFQTVRDWIVEQTAVLSAEGRPSFDLEYVFVDVAVLAEGSEDGPTSEDGESLGAFTKAEAAAIWPHNDFEERADGLYVKGRMVARIPRDDELRRS